MHSFTVASHMVTVTSLLLLLLLLWLLQCLSVLTRIIRECWVEKSASRLTSLRVKKTLAKLCLDEGIRP